MDSRPFFLTACMAGVLCACTSPRLQNNDGVTYHIHVNRLTGEGNGNTCSYPRDAESQQKLNEWIEYNNQRWCSPMFFEYAPEISLTFPPQQRGNDSTTRMDVAFLRHDVMIETTDKILPRIREKGEKDRMFEEYLLKMGSEGKTGR